jgi:excinuclease ABC subunit B
MRLAIDETNRRRAKQVAYNELHGITPESIRKRVHDVIRGQEDDAVDEAPAPLDPWERELLFDDTRQELAELENEMWEASEKLDFERAAAVRDRIRELEARLQGREVLITPLPGQAKRVAPVAKVEAAGRARKARA